MIDVHVLTHEGTKSEWLDRCLASLEGEPAIVHVIDNSGCAVGPGRAKGYARGSAEFVSYVDSDDYVLPGTYATVLKALEKHKAVCTLEQVVSESGYVCPTLRRGHVVVGFRRADVEPLLPLMEATPWCADIFTRQELNPTQLDWLGVVTTARSGTARSRVTHNQFILERASWPIQTARQ